MLERISGAIRVLLGHAVATSKIDVPMIEEALRRLYQTDSVGQPEQKGEQE